MKRPRAIVVGHAFDRLFIARTRELRLASGKSVAQIARRLGIRRATYEKYETDEPLPHRLLERFCKAVGCDIEELFMQDDGLNGVERPDATDFLWTPRH